MKSLEYLSSTKLVTRVVYSSTRGSPSINNDKIVVFSDVIIYYMVAQYKSPEKNWHNSAIT